jgi:hypothetical protein
MYFRPFLLRASGLSSSSPMSMSAIPSVTSPLAGPTKCDKRSFILSIRAYKGKEMWIGRPTDLFLFHNSRICLPLGGPSQVSVDKTRQCDVTASVTGRVCSLLCVTCASNEYGTTLFPTEQGDVSPAAVKACRINPFTSTWFTVSKAKTQ